VLKRRGKLIVLATARLDGTSAVSAVRKHLTVIR
jgi:hypothetical protein